MDPAFTPPAPPSAPESPTAARAADGDQRVSDLGVPANFGRRALEHRECGGQTRSFGGLHADLKLGPVVGRA